MAITQSPSLNGSTQAFTAADSASLSNTGDQTHEMWVKWTTLPTAGNESLLFSKGVSTGNQRGIEMTMLYTAGVYSFQARTSHLGTDVLFANTNLTTPPTTGVWYHYRFVYISGVGAKITFYVNEAESNDITGMAVSIFDNTDLYRIGGSNTDLPFSAAQFSLVRVWSNQHTTDDKCTVYGSAQTNLQAEWSLDNVLTDVSGNTNTLTNVGSTSFSADVPSCLAGSLCNLPLLGAG